MKPIGIVGAGAFGTTLAKILSENNHNVLLWGYEQEICSEINQRHTNLCYIGDVKLPNNIIATQKLKYLCDSCELIFVAIPSHVFRSIMIEMGKYVMGDKILVHCTKGLEEDTAKRMSEIVREESCLRKIGVLCGPMITNDLLAREFSGALIASAYEEVRTKVRNLLGNEYLHIYEGSDLVGAEIGGAYKNIIALATGLADGLKLGISTKAFLMTRGLHEMAQLGLGLGARWSTFGGMAGMGDLIATCASFHSLNRQFGERLAQGEALEQVLESTPKIAESIRTIKAVYALERELDLTLPIMHTVYEFLYQGLDLKAAAKELFSYSSRYENIDFSL